MGGGVLVLGKGKGTGRSLCKAQHVDSPICTVKTSGADLSSPLGGGLFERRAQMSPC